ncbi:low temperature requirement protein A [Lactobacillus sp. LL6]|nr:low temperature requirement protein A [Lactobacillus sp. LL6]
MQALKEKHVSKIALFYDLVFVYMISKTTEIIHHIHHGMVSPVTFGLFAIIVLIFISSWIVQTIFTNRYGKSSWSDIFFYFLDMMILLFMSNSFDSNNLKEMRVLFVSAGLLSLTLATHYLITYFQVKNKIDKKITITYFKFLIIRAICLFIGGTLDNMVGFLVAIAGLLLSWIMPSLMKNYTLKHPIIFSHFLERLNLLIIIIFGETIIGTADYFRPQTLSIYSIFIFIIVAGLFLAYVLQFDWLINEDQKDDTGNLLIYLHYFIIFGISLLTVSLKFIHEEEANSIFAVSCLYCGMLLTYLGLLIASHYNKKIYPLKLKTVLIFLLTVLFGYGICIYNSSFEVITITTCLVVIVNSAYLSKLALSGRKNINI